MSTSPAISSSTGRPRSPRVLVVGVDQGGRSTGAVVWAAEEAERTGCALHLVTATAQGARAEVEQEQVRAGLVGLARRLVLTEISCEVREGSIHEVLLTAAREASMLVVGRRGFGSVHRLVVGSVSVAMSAEADVPVVVVPEQWLQPSMSSAPMVLGLDPDAFDSTSGPGTPDPEHDALAFACARAARMRIPLIVVSSPPVLPPPPLGTEHAARQRHAAAQQLEDRLAPWRAAWPEVEMVARSTDLAPGPALVEAGRSAQLTVVGRRPAGPLALRRPGGTTRHVLRHSARPVAVVPLTRSPDETSPAPTPTEKEDS